MQTNFDGHVHYIFITTTKRAQITYKHSKCHQKKEKENVQHLVVVVVVVVFLYSIFKYEKLIISIN